MLQPEKCHWSLACFISNERDMPLAQTILRELGI